MEYILASGSPRRKDLLTQAGIEYKVMVSGAEEHCTCELPHQIVEELSRIKAISVADMLEEDGDYCVIGADTVVAYEDNIMGKPTDKACAVDMLKKLSGNTHQVYTGVTLVRIINGKRTIRSFYERTDVTMYELADSMIEKYVDSGEPMDKAGAYGIQGGAAIFVKGISGDYNNVVGLPIARLYQELCKL